VPKKNQVGLTLRAKPVMVQNVPPQGRSHTGQSSFDLCRMVGKKFTFFISLFKYIKRFTFILNEQVQKMAIFRNAFSNEENIYYH
jgi:hypothetical protein